MITNSPGVNNAGTVSLTDPPEAFLSKVDKYLSICPSSRSFVNLSLSESALTSVGCSGSAPKIAADGPNVAKSMGLLAVPLPLGPRVAPVAINVLSNRSPTIFPKLDCKASSRLDLPIFGSTLYSGLFFLISFSVNLTNSVNN